MNRLVFYGKVQGVGFRSSVLRIARQIQIRGYVRNLNDGTVELVSDCDREKLEELVKRIKEELGRYIKIERVLVQTDFPFEEKFDDFSIRY